MKYTSEKYASSFVSFLEWCTFCEKCMPCMCCGKILRCSSSTLNGWFLLFLLESKICIKHACGNFCIVIIYCLESRKNMFHAWAVGKILRCSSSTFNGWFLLFLLESKICIKQACDNFCTVIVCYEDHRKNANSVVWHFSQYKVFSCS